MTQKYEVKTDADGTQYGALLVQSAKNGDQYLYFDLVDAPQVLAYTWRVYVQPSHAFSLPPLALQLRAKTDYVDQEARDQVRALIADEKRRRGGISTREAAFNLCLDWPIRFKTSVAFHNYIMDAQPDERIQAVNKNFLDCRRANLKVVITRKGV